METKFKTGDKVKIINRKPDNTTGCDHRTGLTAFVCSQDSTFYLYSKQNKKGEYLGILENNNRWAFNDDDLELITENPEFIVGKWYKNLGSDKTHIGKFSGWYNDKIISVSEYIFNGVLKGPSDNFDSHWQNAILLTDLSEIQKWLPDEHPDKQIKIMEKNEFKKDDYIICLSGVFDPNDDWNNICFKQRENHNSLQPIRDLVNSDCNGWKKISFKENSYWRYATEQEIAEYERLGKPYGVTTLNVKKDDKQRPLKTFEVGKWYTNPCYPEICSKKYKYFRVDTVEQICRAYWYNSFTFDQVADENWNIINVHKTQANTDFDQEMELVEFQQPKVKSVNLVGRYLKALVDKPYGGNVKKDDYGKITTKNGDTADFVNHKNYACSNALKEPGKFEIMPEGFIPPTKEQDLLEEAKRRYPVGTRFKSPQNQGIFTVETYDELHSRWIGNTFLIVNVGNPSKGEYLCNNGVWAEIIEEVTEEWKVEDWLYYNYDNVNHSGGTFEKIINLANNKVVTDKNEYLTSLSELLSGKHKNSIRKALPHEIPSQKPVVKTKAKLFEQPIMKNYTAEEALAELKRRGFKEGCKYSHRNLSGSYDKKEIHTAGYNPTIKGMDLYIDCGNGYLWHKEYPHLLHEGPISSPISEEFVLPDKWYITVTRENRKVLSKWRTAGGDVTDGYLHEGNGIWTKYRPSDRPEITFEQFQKYVLKQEFVKSENPCKEIILPEVYMGGIGEFSVTGFNVYSEKQPQDYSNPESLIKKPMLI